MDAGASVIAFVTLGLASVKSLYQLVSAVKDGPQKLKDVSNAVRRLQSNFEVINGLPDRSRILTESPSLVTLVELCNKDIIRFEKKLVGFTLSSTEQMHGKLWKKLKLFLSEKDLQDIQAAVEEHTNALTLQINFDQTRSLHCLVSDTRQILIHESNQATMAETQVSVLANISDRVSDCTSQNLAIHNFVEALAQKMDTTPSSRCQVDDISAKLASLEKELSKMNLNFNSILGSPASTKVDKGAGSEVDTSLGPSSALKDSIRRLCNFANHAEFTMISSEAGEIVRDLDLLLQSTFFEELSNDSSEKETLKDAERHHILGINQIRGQFLAAPSIHMNQNLRRPLLPRSGARISNKRKYQKYAGPHGILEVSRNIRHQKMKHGAEIKEVEDRIFSIIFTPRNDKPAQVIKAMTHQRQTSYDFSILPPSLSINPILPRDHYVFECVKHGQMDELLTLLKIGDGYIRARDRNGASLLHYSYKSPEICNFLIQNGADVDEVADCALVDDNFSGNWLRNTLSLTEGVRGDDGLKCFKQLLVAGADPTLGILQLDKEPSASVLFITFLTSPKHYAKAMLDLGGIFFDNDGDGNSEPLLLTSCHNVQIEHMRLLIERGADVNIKDSQGQNCLHYLARRLPWHWSEILEALVFLIKSGADIFAEDLKGFSASEIAYKPSDCETSCPGDVWDAALARCGHDIKDFRIKYPRLGIYTSQTNLEIPDICRNNYTREDFKNMWAGMEHLCHYYSEDDSPSFEPAAFNLSHDQSQIAPIVIPHSFSGDGFFAANLGGRDILTVEEVIESLDEEDNVVLGNWQNSKSQITGPGLVFDDADLWTSEMQPTSEVVPMDTDAGDASMDVYFREALWNPWSAAETQV